jgi:hypothetical protein
MPLVMHVDPEATPMSWDQFCKSTPPYSIALDGYVSDVSLFDASAPRANFDHHSLNKNDSTKRDFPGKRIDRLITRATCGQLLIAIRTGLLQCFRDEGGVHAELYVLDGDQDVCTSWHLVKHSEQIEREYNPRLNRLVTLEDTLDSFGGAYPLPIDLPDLQELAWVFEPYTNFRLSGGVDRKNGDEFVSMIQETEQRICLYVMNEGHSIPLQTKYDIISSGIGWCMVHEEGAQARTAMVANGIRAFISVRERGDGTYAYTVARTAPFVRFSVPAILDALNAAEGCTIDRWGGSDTIGGSPHVAGSKLNPHEVKDIVDHVLSLCKYP